MKTQTETSMRYKPVEEGGLVNHFQFYLAYLGVAIILLLLITACVVNADKIDKWFSELMKYIFL